MLAHKRQWETIATLLEADVHCPVVLANQTAPAPPYPFLSFTILTPVHAEQGTYCFDKGIYYQPMLQTWSLTAQSDDYAACQEIGMRMYDFFARAGRAALYQNQIAVASLTDLTARDNLLTVQYVYRCGMDVTFRMMHQLEVVESRIVQEMLQHSCNGKKPTKMSINRKDESNGIIGCHRKGELGDQCGCGADRVSAAACRK